MEIIYEAHTKNKAHHKAYNTAKNIKEGGYFWDNMKTDVEKLVKMCEVCQIRTKNPDKKSEVKYIESSEVKERFQVDLVQLSDYLSED